MVCRGHGGYGGGVSMRYCYAFRCCLLVVGQRLATPRHRTKPKPNRNASDYTDLAVPTHCSHTILTLLTILVAPYGVFSLALSVLTRRSTYLEWAQLLCIGSSDLFFIYRLDALIIERGCVSGVALDTARRCCAPR